MFSDSKNILVCPLDWGLGHATRCVPIINGLLNLGHQVIIGADKNPLAFLSQEFPQLKTVVIPGYEVTYGKKENALKLFYESVQFFNFIKKENTFIDAIIEELNIDTIISDNRYGLWSKKVQSIIITHQLYVKAPIGETIAHKKIAQLIGKFDQCWIPDVEGPVNLSGDLSHLKPFKYRHHFIGSLSRFNTKINLKSITPSRAEEYDVMAIISGPEPQRSIFEKMILEQVQNNKLKAVIVRGLPSVNEELQLEYPGLKIFNHLSTENFIEYIQKSKIVVCRGGYSSIMDLIALRKEAILVPTPGQTEQEYLADHHFKEGNFYTQKQSDFNLAKALIECKNFSPKGDFNGGLAIKTLLEC